MATLPYAPFKSDPASRKPSAACSVNSFTFRRSLVPLKHVSYDLKGITLPMLQDAPDGGELGDGAGSHRIRLSCVIPSR